MSTSRQSGFSLLEVMIAILVLGIGLAGLTQGVNTALSSSKDAEQVTLAAQMAAGQIELLRAEGYVTDGETEGEGTQGLAAYRWRQTVKPGNIDGLHEVTVTVETARGGQTIYELSTLLFDPPWDSLLDETKPATGKDKDKSRDSRRRGRKP